MKTLTIKQVLILHEIMIKKHGGSSGIRDNGMLESALNRPFATYDGKDLYPDIYLKISALIQSIVKNHPFIDGNKRTAFLSAFTLLKSNNIKFASSSKEIVDFMTEVASTNLSVDQIAVWLKIHSLPHPRTKSGEFKK